jgi:hypothetical protein
MSTAVTHASHIISHYIIKTQQSAIQYNTLQTNHSYSTIHKNVRLYLLHFFIRCRYT